jgi:transcriptional regulator with XRE-family HTH domain
LDELGKKLKELRLERNITQRQAARSLGISNTRLSDYEAGKTHGTGKPAIPNRDLLAKMAEFYGYPLDTLLTLARYPMTEPTPAPVPSQEETEAKEVAEIYRILKGSQRRLFLKVARAFRAEALAEQTEES